MHPFPIGKYAEFVVFKKLNSPGKVQDFLDGFRINFEPKGETCRSPLRALRSGEAHCAEGAMLAAAIFWSHGEQPLLLDLKVAKGKGDMDHVVALFKEGGRWGAVSKTNHPVLRYRDPIYKTIRELALSYFNEYFMVKNGLKTLRSYSAPYNLLREGGGWLVAEDDLWDTMVRLDESRHFDVMEKSAVRRLRLADPLEMRAGGLTEWSEKE